MTNPTIERRDALKGLLAISAAGALAACGDSSTKTRPSRGNERLRYAKPGQFFGVEELAMIAALSQTIIPKTDTAGAVEAGVPGVIQDLASSWADDPYREYMRGGLAKIGAKLAKGGMAFDAMSADQQNTALAAYDADVFGGKVEDQFYRDFKSTVVRAYYMSEPGATEELAYEAVPGEWRGCVPLSEYPKTWAT